MILYKKLAYGQQFSGEFLNCLSRNLKKFQCKLFFLNIFRFKKNIGHPLKNFVIIEKIWFWHFETNSYICSVLFWLVSISNCSIYKFATFSFSVFASSAYSICPDLYLFDHRSNLWDGDTSIKWGAGVWFFFFKNVQISIWEFLRGGEDVLNFCPALTQ